MRLLPEKLFILQKWEVRTSSGRGGVISASCQDRAGKRAPPDASSASAAADAGQGGLLPHSVPDEFPPPTGGKQVGRTAPQEFRGQVATWGSRSRESENFGSLLECTRCSGEHQNGRQALQRRVASDCRPSWTAAAATTATTHDSSRSTNSSLKRSMTKNNHEARGITRSTTHRTAHLRPPCRSVPETTGPPSGRRPRPQAPP